MRRLFYSYPEMLPAPYARTISVVKTCAALQNFFDLTLVTTHKSQTRQCIEAAYDVTLDRMKIVPVRRQLLGINSTAIYHFSLRRILAEQTPCVIYVRHLKTAAELLRRRRSGEMVIFESHELFHQTALDPAKREALKASEEFVYRHADGLIFITDTLRDDVNDIFGIKDTRNQIVLPLGFDAPAEIPAKDFSRIDEVFYVGSLQAWKGVECLIEAMKQVPAPIRLTLMGRADEQVLQSLKQLADRLGLTDRIQFLPPVSHEQAIALLKTRSRLCVMPNTQTALQRYTSPLKLFEYMGNNNIIIYSQIPSIQSVIAGQPIGVGVEPGNPVALARAIADVCANPPAYQSLAANACQLVRQFSWQSRAKRSCEFIEQLHSPA